MKRAFVHLALYGVLFLTAMAFAGFGLLAAFARLVSTKPTT